MRPVPSWRIVALAVIVATGALAPAPVAAQRQMPPRAGAEELGPPARRAQLERRIREALWAQTERRVGLSGEQMSQLAELSRRLEPRRAELQRQARLARQALRQQMMAAAPDQERVGAQLDSLFALQRRQHELVEQEQRELARFMTPVQRARYFALQEQFRARLEELRMRGAGHGAGARARPLSPP